MHTSTVMGLKLSEDPALYEPALIPNAYCTALPDLVDTARLQRGESLLIHGATGAVGQACIKMAQHRGDNKITAGSSWKCQLLTQTSGIPANCISSTRHADGFLAGSCWPLAAGAPT